MPTDASERPGPPEASGAQEPRARPGRLARSTAFFSFATGLSRVLGLVREVVAARYFGVSAAMSAFTIAFQVPNLIRALVADSALQGAFVPVFTELLEKGERKEAFRVASSLFFLILLILGGDHGAVRDLRRPDDRAGGARLRRRPGAARPHREPRPADGPDRRAAGALRAGGGDAQLVRPLQRAGARARGLEPGDHRRSGRARAGVPRGRPDLRVRHRDPGRDGGPVRAAPAVAEGARRPPDACASTGATSACGGC